MRTGGQERKQVAISPNMINMILFMGFIIWVLVILAVIIRLTRRGIHILANPPIHSIVFLSAKILSFVSCLFIPLGVLWPGMKWYSLPAYLSWLAPGLFVAGSLLAITAMKKTRRRFDFRMVTRS